MPNTKSAIRRVKRVKKQSLVNKLRRSRYRLAIKKINKLIEKKDLQAIKKFYPKFQSELMRIAKTGVVKRENASRKIARISKKIKKINKLIEKKDTKEINKFFPIFQSELMKIAKTGVVKKENASRKIARVSKKIKKINK